MHTTSPRDFKANKRHTYAPKPWKTNEGRRRTNEGRPVTAVMPRFHAVSSFVTSNQMPTVATSLFSLALLSNTFFCTVFPPTQVQPRGHRSQLTRSTHSHTIAPFARSAHFRQPPARSSALAHAPRSLSHLLTSACKAQRSSGRIEQD